MLLKILTKFPWLLKQLKKKILGSFPPKGHFRCLPVSPAVWPYLALG